MDEQGGNLWFWVPGIDSTLWAVGQGRVGGAPSCAFASNAVFLLGTCFEGIGWSEQCHLGSWSLPLWLLFAPQTNAIQWIWAEIKPTKQPDASLVLSTRAVETSSDTQFSYLAEGSSLGLISSKQTERVKGSNLDHLSTQHEMHSFGCYLTQLNKCADRKTHFDLKLHRSSLWVELCLSQRSHWSPKLLYLPPYLRTRLQNR